MAGNTLLIVVVLLLLASLFVIFALNVGRFEQRTSGNDLRAKIAQEVAESGVSLGVEYLNAHRPIFATDDNWRSCGAAETEFPCGAVPAARRSTMFTYMAAGTGGDTLANRPLPVQLASTSAGGFAATRQVGAVLCRVKPLPVAGGSAECATDIADASTTWLVTVVSKGTLTDEGSSSTITQTIGAYNIFNITPGIPPLVASGSVAVGGALQIVTAPDAAGPGVSTSIWTRLDVDSNGTPNTCFFDEFFRQGGTNAGPPGYYDGIAVCDTCNCPTGQSLSFGSGGNLCEGADIVDIEGSGTAYDKAAYDAYDKNVAACPVSANLSIHREEFPADLFEFLFGQKAWQDDVTPDTLPCARDDLGCHFSEVRIIEPCTYIDPTTNAQVTATLPADTCYLLNIKNKIHIGDGVNDAAECTALGTATSGVVWVHNQPLAGTSMMGLTAQGLSCDVKIRGLSQLGKPSAPVALIYDGALTQVNGLKLYGLFFLREPNASTTISATTGGSAELGINGNMVIYGAAVVQGRIDSGGGGNAAVVYNKDVLFNLINDSSNLNPASMPGSWTDRMRY
jgi:hypothetical protein